MAVDKDYIRQLELYKEQLQLDIEYNNRDTAYIKDQILTMKRKISIIEKQTESYNKSMKWTDEEIEHQKNK